MCLGVVVAVLQSCYGKNIRNCVCNVCMHAYMAMDLPITSACTKSKNNNYRHGRMIGKDSLSETHLKKLKPEEEKQRHSKH